MGVLHFRTRCPACTVSLATGGLAPDGRSPTSTRPRYQAGAFVMSNRSEICPGYDRTRRCSGAHFEEMFRASARSVFGSVSLRVTGRQDERPPPHHGLHKATLAQQRHRAPGGSPRHTELLTQLLFRRDRPVRPQNPGSDPLADDVSELYVHGCRALRIELHARKVGGPGPRDRIGYGCRRARTGKATFKLWTPHRRSRSSRSPASVTSGWPSTRETPASPSPPRRTTSSP